MHQQLLTVGNMMQVIGDFKRYLETGEKAVGVLGFGKCPVIDVGYQFVGLSDFRASHMSMKSPAPQKSPAPS